MDGELTTWGFSQLADERLREEFPDADPSINSLMVILNRAAEDLTGAIETQAHRPVGLSWLAYRMLFVLWIAGPLEPARIADLMHTSRATVTNLSMSFIKDGLINRRPSQTDRRSVQLTLTPRGVERVREAYLKQSDIQKQLLSVLTAEEQQILRLLLTKLIRERNA